MKAPTNRMIGNEQINSININFPKPNSLEAQFLRGMINHAKIYAREKLGIDSHPNTKANRMTLTSQLKNAAKPDATPPRILSSVSR